MSIIQKEMEQKAMTNIYCRIPRRFQSTSNRDTERLNLLECYLRKTTGYTEEDAVQIRDQQAKEYIGQETAKEIDNIKKAQERTKQTATAYLTLFKAKFKPFVDGTPVDWSYQFKNPETGEVSKTVLDIVTEQFVMYADSKAIDEPEETLKAMMYRFENTPISYQFNKVGKNETSRLRVYFTLRRVS